MKKSALRLLFVWMFLSLGTVHAESFRETEDIVISPDFCSLYPIALSDSVLASAS